MDGVLSGLPFAVFCYSSAGCPSSSTEPGRVMRFPYTLTPLLCLGRHSAIQSLVYLPFPISFAGESMPLLGGRGGERGEDRTLGVQSHAGRDGL
ncbi:hypothetical protein BO94DRAFT_80154 [Aspergillus sclerotioniger CBS 115572]|uniref:Uncharacterized protein n=1 Tax=Aspergillus sclerotioniger CBS 115572 TaxID=1450535 RepID=A0A317WJ62_9EURO|nr:hypothetical protein BO94DRAFT_80154 [Aspergillus sclerotioniger CBS 115572]PWY86359.1 hypothetical protein BO94DRAFT_80154 [Aspergillus sclerotioniger CBS 115572]